MIIKHSLLNVWAHNLCSIVGNSKSIVEKTTQDNEMFDYHSVLKFQHLGSVRKPLEH